jgi:predicted RNase H-like HicB family nuclease
VIAGRYGFPARLEPDEDGRPVVHFPYLPEASTDGADDAEALAEAADCLSEALAGRIDRGEDIPPPSRLPRGRHWIAPDRRARRAPSRGPMGAPRPKHAVELGLDRDYPGHSMRATFIPSRSRCRRAQGFEKLAGHRDSGMINGYDWRGYNPE